MQVREAYWAAGVGVAGEHPPGTVFRLDLQRSRPSGWVGAQVLGPPPPLHRHPVGHPLLPLCCSHPSLQAFAEKFEYVGASGTVQSRAQLAEWLTDKGHGCTAAGVASALAAAPPAVAEAAKAAAKAGAEPGAHSRMGGWLDRWAWLWAAVLQWTWSGVVGGVHKGRCAVAECGRPAANAGCPVAGAERE